MNTDRLNNMKHQIFDRTSNLLTKLQRTVTSKQLSTPYPLTREKSPLSGHPSQVIISSEPLFIADDTSNTPSSVTEVSSYHIDTINKLNTLLDQIDALTDKITYDPSRSHKNFFLSDLHINHNREFVYKVRGFESIVQMNRDLIINWNNKVSEEDDVYIPGDLFLGQEREQSLFILSKLNGRFHIIVGNHDTIAKLQDMVNYIVPRYPGKLVEIVSSKYIKYTASDNKSYHFYVTHFPCLTGNLNNPEITQMTINISGHTHSQDEFFYDLPYIYNVACDANDCTPVELEEIIEKIKNKVQECIREAAE